jgi:hypothetical protein
MVLDGTMRLTMTEGTSKLVIEIESDEADLPVDVALGGICLGLMRYCEKHGLNVMEGLELAKQFAKEQVVVTTTLPSEGVN